METATKILGTTDEVTTCDCCGREDLTKTVAIEVDGEPMFFGVVCAAKKLQQAARDIKTMARKADDAKFAAASKARQEAGAMEFARQQAKLDAMFPSIAGASNRFAQVQALLAQGMRLSAI